VKKHKRRHHSQPTKQAHNPAPVIETIPKDNAPNSDPRPAPRGKDNEATQKLEKGMLRWTRVVGVFTSVLAIVGGIQAWAFIQSERAFLSLAAMQFDGVHLAAEKRVTILVDVKNSGRSTGFVTDFNITTTITPSATKLPKIPDYQQGPGIAVGPIVAAGTKKVIANPRGLNNAPTLILPQDVAASIKSKTLLVYIFGYISYTDEFTLFGPRKSGFCYLYIPDRGNESIFDDCPYAEYTYAH
jgi:hypothetical protein